MRIALDVVVVSVDDKSRGWSVEPRVLPVPNLAVWSRVAGVGSRTAQVVVRVAVGLDERCECIAGCRVVMGVRL